MWTCFSWWLIPRIPKKQTIIKVTKESFRGATVGRYRGRGQFWKCAGSFLGRWEFLPNWRKTLVQKERVDCGTSWKFAGTTLFRAWRTSIPRMSCLEVSYDVDYLQVNLWEAWFQYQFSGTSRPTKSEPLPGNLHQGFIPSFIRGHIAPVLVTLTWNTFKLVFTSLLYCKLYFYPLCY